MKAVIMAGGEGKRLRPVSCGCPKPMVRLLGRPLMEHIIALLRESGLRQICVTLCSQPEAVRGYFGSGEKFGVEICYREETVPLGTAGGVKNCAGFIGGDDVLVISGDAACVIDLGRLIEAHREHRPCVTIALAERSDPLRYGLGLTEASGRVTGFIEKPDWSRVVTDMVNTGIYILSPEAVAAIPGGVEYDFGRDLFPELLRRGSVLRGEPAAGYWCDIGTPEEYLKCSIDALRGALPVTAPFPQLAPGAYCASPLPESAKLIAPCAVAEDVLVAPGAVIGPDACIDPGSRIGPFARIERSVVGGGEVGARAELDGAIVCRGAAVPGGAKLSRGEIAAPEGAERAPERPPLSARTSPEGVRLCEIPCRSRAQLMRRLSEAMMEAGADFSDGLTIARGGAHVRVAPEAGRSALVVESFGEPELDRRLAEGFQKLSRRLEGE